MCHVPSHQSRVSSSLCDAGETADTLKPGRKVQATVQRVSDAAAWVTLSDINDISAVILNTDISSTGEVRPGDRLRRGDVIPAR